MTDSYEIGLIKCYAKQEIQRTYDDFEYKREMR